jgi:hypothetical protein
MHAAHASGGPPVLPGPAFRAVGPGVLALELGRRDQGVASLVVEDIADRLLRQAVANEAMRRWGRRSGGHGHGR